MKSCYLNVQWLLWLYPIYCTKQKMYSNRISLDLHSGWINMSHFRNVGLLLWHVHVYNCIIIANTRTSLSLLYCSFLRIYCERGIVGFFTGLIRAFLKNVSIYLTSTVSNFFITWDIDKASASCCSKVEVLDLTKLLLFKSKQMLFHFKLSLAL